MKTLLSLLALLAAAQVHANTTFIKEGDLSLSPASSKIISVKPICPTTPNGVSCMAYGSRVKILVTMNGCLDKFGGHVFKLQEPHRLNPSEGATLNFTAFNISNEASLAALCVEAPTKIVEIFVPYEGRIDLLPMDYKTKKSEIEPVTEFVDGDKVINNVSNIEILSVRPICPSNNGGPTCLAMGSNVKLKMTLNGCMDRLAGVATKFIQDPRSSVYKGKLAVAALNVSNSASLVTFCYAAPTEIISVYVPFNGKVELEKVNFEGTKSL